MNKQRSFLFLQGVCSPFFSRLADRLKADGHKVFKVNFNGGDTAYWGLRSAWPFRGAVNSIPTFLEKKYLEFEITDQILFGDRRPVHRVAVDLRKQYGIRTHVFEEGYFRPYWITLERDGVNANSLLPRDPDWFHETGRHLPDYGDGIAFHAPFFKRAIHDIAYHIASSLNPLLFPQYRTHAPCNAALEYVGYIRRFTSIRVTAIDNQVTTKKLFNSGTPFFLLPLQLNSDAQIRDHSQFNDMRSVIEYVMASFAQHASGDAWLVIKNHPLDMGLVNYRRIIKQLAKQFDLSGRVVYLESADLFALLQHARGVVTVNSTVGSLALEKGCPTMALSNPIYNLPGLTFQGSLDEFWRDGVVPNDKLFRHFKNAVIHTTQINGGFYSRIGIDLAVENCRYSLQSEHSPLEKLL